MLGKVDSKWIVSARWDLMVFLGSVVFSLLFLLPVLNGLNQWGKFPLWAFLLFIIGIDASHVYCTIYRVYLDKNELRRRWRLYFGVIPLLYFLGVGLYLYHPMMFWSSMAYYATFHFIKQIEGYVMLYRIKNKETESWSKRLDQIAIYFATVYPIVYWHHHLPKNFDWFLKGDYLYFYQNWPDQLKYLVNLIASYGWIVVCVFLLMYLAIQIYQFLRWRKVYYGKWVIIIGTYVTWYLGIVFYDNDIIFTSLIVVFHGVPYMALIWLYCHNKWCHQEKRNWQKRWFQKRFIFLFVGLLILLASIEETLWDLLVWGDYLRGISNWDAIRSSLFLAFIVPFLSLPQMIHYYLDRKIWKFNASNPDLSFYLRFKE